MSQPGKAFEVKITVAFSLDADGILQVAATEERSGVSSKITINNSQNRLSEKEIRKMYIDAEQFRASDKREQDKVQASLALSVYVQSMEIILYEHKAELDSCPQLAAEVRTALNATKSTLSESGDTLQRPEYYADIQRTLEARCSPLLEKIMKEGELSDMLKTQYQAQIYEKQQALKEAGGIRVYAGDQIIQLV